MHSVSTRMKEFQDKAGKEELAIFSFHIAVIAVGQKKGTGGKQETGKHG